MATSSMDKNFITHFGAIYVYLYKVDKTYVEKVLHQPGLQVRGQTYPVSFKVRYMGGSGQS